MRIVINYLAFLICVIGFSCLSGCTNSTDETQTLTSTAERDGHHDHADGWEHDTHSGEHDAHGGEHDAHGGEHDAHGGEHDAHVYDNEEDVEHVSDLPD